MVSQYPHIIRVYLSQVAQQDANGDWITLGGSEETVLAGRFEPAKANAMIKGIDGTQVAISGIIYMPLSSEAIIKPGTVIQVENGSEVILKDTAKQFSKGQLNMRAWV